MNNDKDKKGSSGVPEFVSDIGEAIDDLTYRTTQEQKPAAKEQSKNEQPHPRKSTAESAPALLHRAASPLHIAAREGQAESIKELLSAGAQLNARDKDGLTPLHVAAGGGQVESIKELLSAGAQLDARAEDGSTPLHF
ncbi:MAG: ankyrin repeat domain-containing protein, partial [Aphanocapsa feldmannii 277cV]